MLFASVGFRRTLAIVLLATPLTIAQALTDTVQRTFVAQPGGGLDLAVDSGSVTIETTPDPEVRVEVVREAKRSTESAARELFDAQDLEIDEKAGRVRVRSSWRGRGLAGFWKRSNFSVKYTVTVPSRFDVTVRTAGGSIRVADMAGILELRTSGGSIEAGDIDGTVQAGTSGGSIRVRGATGRVDATTSGGGIHLGRTTGPVRATTSGGSIKVESASARVEARTSGGSIRIEQASAEVDAQTSGGSIRVRYVSTPAGDSDLRTTGGGIRVELDDPVAVELDARAVGGGVQANVPVTTEGRISRDTLHGTIRGGGPLLKVRTTGGGIRIDSSAGVR